MAPDERKSLEEYGLKIEKPYKQDPITSAGAFRLLLLIFCVLSCTLLVQQVIYHEASSRYDTAVSVVSYSAQQSEAVSYEAVEAANAPVNINTADLVELCRLPGIGEAKAQAIIDYRTENGLFTYPEEIMNVSGIGEGIFENIRSQIILSDEVSTTE